MSDRQWRWFAGGKHPSARDYIKIGRESAMARAFSEWIESGFIRHNAKTGITPLPSSWRFWMRGSKTDHIVCGVLKDSIDGAGRPHPFFIMGSGHLADWENNWDLLPFACENVWSQMECIATRNHEDAKPLMDEIIQIKAPLADWETFIQRRKEGAATSGQWTILCNRLSNLPKDDPLFHLDERLGETFEILLLCHQFIKSKAPEPPNSVFIGGTIERTFIAPFRRALEPSDFYRLWSPEN